MMTLHGTTRPQIEALDDDALRVVARLHVGVRGAAHGATQ